MTGEQTRTRARCQRPFDVQSHRNTADAGAIIVAIIIAIIIIIIIIVVVVVAATAVAAAMVVVPDNHKRASEDRLFQAAVAPGPGDAVHV